PAVTYGNYLKVDELLSLQVPRSHGPEHDELLFIVIHQVYELWFKELLHELDYAVRLLGEDDGQRVLHTLKRILTILKVQVSQVDILETMTPLEFLSFRERLEAASGFQSDQFRQMEFLLGMKRPNVIKLFPEGSRARGELERRLGEPSLWDAFLRYLHRMGHAIPGEVLDRDPSHPAEPHEGVQAALVRVYREDPRSAQLCERMVDLDEGIQEWRYRHVKMVQRTIGTKKGTGGSEGAAYLVSTLMKPVFPDLWEIRGKL
ncbi:MAG TPA: tryptophan 2,3-dioxygenase family protein, partial [Longimicrobiales bacterium]|nr:tryptophan 2,3-dioxygenase family protein [Longimicrobiales bacterium]